MREINKAITVMEETQIIKTASTEEIERILEEKNNKVIYVSLAYKDINGEKLYTDGIEINGENYNLLMSANPIFAPNKPLNEYREEDLWYMIDKIRNELASQ